MKVIPTSAARRGTSTRRAGPPEAGSAGASESERGGGGRREEGQRTSGFSPWVFSGMMVPSGRRGRMAIPRERTRWITGEPLPKPGEVTPLAALDVAV